MKKSAVVIGAGIVGCSAAWRLASRGLSVTVVERSEIGKDAASTKAAGMLGAQIEAHPVREMQALCVASRERYPEFVAELDDASVEFRRIGALMVAYDRRQLISLQRDVARQKERGLTAELCSAAEVLDREPRLAPVSGGAYFEKEGVLEPRRLLAAVHAAAVRGGVEFQENCRVTGLKFDGDEVSHVQTERGDLAADVVVVAAGSWSSRIMGMERLGLSEGSIEPVRGQMVELKLATPWAGPIVEGPSVYLSPRQDGRMLVGSTVERVGFIDGVTAGALAALLKAAIAMVPEISSSLVLRSWSGFRAAARDELPVIDRIANVVLATGHYRNGIVLAPLTAELVADLATGCPAQFDLTPFSARRVGLGRR